MPQKLLVQQHCLAEARFFVSKGILLFLNCLFMQKGWQWSLWKFFCLVTTWEGTYQSLKRLYVIVLNSSICSAALFSIYSEISSLCPQHVHTTQAEWRRWLGTHCWPLSHCKHLKPPNKTDRSSLEARKRLWLFTQPGAELEIFLQRDVMGSKGLHGIQGEMVSLWKTSL